jgi:hypothetical protein
VARYDRQTHAAVSVEKFAHSHGGRGVVAPISSDCEQHFKQSIHRRIGPFFGFYLSLKYLGWVFEQTSGAIRDK